MKLIINKKLKFHYCFFKLTAIKNLDKYYNWHFRFIEKNIIIENFHPLATNPATIEVPKKTMIKMITIMTSIKKNFIQRDLYKLGPSLSIKIT